MPVLGTATSLSSGIVNTTTPEAYGATGNNPAHDDAPAIEAAIAAVVAACIADGSYVCEVLLGEKTYYANRAPVANPTINGSPTYSFAQINLPWLAWQWQVPGSTPLVTLHIRSAASRTGSNTSFALQPSTIATTVTSGGGFVPGSGVASVIGGPARSGPTTPKQWSGINLVMDGINIKSGVNPALSGIDATGINTVQLGRVKVYVPTNGYAIPTKCTNPASWGVIFPINQNGGIIEADDLSVYGYYTGISLPEHLNANNVLLYWNRIAVGCDQTGDHYAYIQMLQPVHNDFLFGRTAGNADTITDCIHGAALVIGILDGEGALGIKDANNMLNVTGSIAIGRAPLGAIASPTNGRDVRFVDLNRAIGTVTAPAVPASTTALTNNYGRDANVTITGGTVTSIVIDGVATGLTSGSFIVPINRTIAITYSSAPTWNWVLF